MKDKNKKDNKDGKEKSKFTKEAVTDSASPVKEKEGKEEKD